MITTKYNENMQCCFWKKQKIMKIAFVLFFFVRVNECLNIYVDNKNNFRINTFSTTKFDNIDLNILFYWYATTLSRCDEIDVLR